MFCRSKFYIRDGALIGDFRDSLNPMIWRMELSRVHAVGFKVQQNGSVWDIGMEGGSGGFSPIASYSSQRDANKALSSISCSLRHQGWVRRLMQVMLLLIFGVVVVTLISSTSSVLQELGRPKIALPVAPAQPLGQSLSADQILRAPPAH